MALTPSNMVGIGTPAPAFVLPDVRNDTLVSLEDLKGQKGTVIIFMSNHCPYVVHVENEIGKISAEYEGDGISFIGISSNDIVNYADDSPDKLRAQMDRAGFNFPYLYDETQEVAKSFDAACTPDFYLFDEQNKLVYRGRLDESRPGNDIPVTGNDLRQAIDNLKNGLDQEEAQYPSIGCNIKWKS